jgi:putative membrane protein
MEKGLPSFRPDDHTEDIMLTEALLAWIHFLAIGALLVPIVAEAVLLRPDMTPATLRRIGRYDVAYLCCAIAVIVTGGLRLFLGAKGAHYYFSNPWFHAKMTVFILIALCSILPTIRFIRWGRQARRLPEFVPTHAEIAKARRWVMVQAHLLILMPLFAALMALGIGA